MLNPEGTLFVSNFTDNTRESAFMKAFMDWHLIYRNKQDMGEMAECLLTEEIEYFHIYPETLNQDNRFLNLEITKVR